MNLYTIEQDLLSLYAEIEENGGFLSEEMEERVVIAQENFHSKMENYLKFIRVLEGDVNMYNAEIVRIQNGITAKTNLKDRLQKAVLDALKMFGRKDPIKEIWRMEIGTFRLNTVGTVSTEIIDLSEIPDMYKQITVSLAKLPVEKRNRVINLINTINDDDEIVNSVKEEEIAPLTPLKEAIQSNNPVTTGDVITSEAIPGVKLNKNFRVTIK